MPDSKIVHDPPSYTVFKFNVGDRLIVPINITRSHWVLFIAVRVTKSSIVMAVLDSLNKYTIDNLLITVQDESIAAHDAVMSYLHHIGELEDTLDVDYKVVVVDPAQEDTTACGYYTCAFADAVVQYAIDFTEEKPILCLPPTRVRDVREAMWRQFQQCEVISGKKVAGKSVKYPIPYKIHTEEINEPKSGKKAIKGSKKGSSVEYSPETPPPSSKRSPFSDRDSRYKVYSSRRDNGMDVLGSPISYKPKALQFPDESENTASSGEENEKGKNIVERDETPPPSPAKSPVFESETQATQEEVQEKLGSEEDTEQEDEKPAKKKKSKPAPKTPVRTRLPSKRGKKRGAETKDKSPQEKKRRRVHHHSVTSSQTSSQT